MLAKYKQTGFTIVELLIVIVVIGILAAITIVAYNGVQSRARDAQRRSDISTITKALELYYIDNGNYPPGSGSTTLNASWSTTADPSWQNLATLLKPHISKLPADPTSTPNANVQVPNGYNYAYFSGSYCGVTNRQVYIIVYRYEGSAQEDKLIGTCNTPLLGPYGSGNASNYRVVR